MADCGMRLSIVVPACNEEFRIGCMLDAYLPFFTQRYGQEVEFIIVVNGSTDRTEEIVRNYAARYPLVRVMVDPRRIGKGGALIMGFAEARGDLVGFVDADGATPPEAFQQLVENIGEAGAIIASRWRPGAVVSPRQPPLRRLSSRVFHLLARLAFGLRLTDTQCGAKLMRREALMRILPHLGITQWAFDVDLLLHLQRAGFRIVEIPTTWRDQAGSKVELLRASLEMLAALARLRLLYSPFKWVVTLYDRYVGPFIHPPGMEEDRLFRHSLLLIAGSQVANVCNVLFQAAMARMLPQTEYGVMAAMLALLAIASAPVASLSQSVAHYSALFSKQQRREMVKSMLGRMSRELLPVALGLIGLAWLGGPWLAEFLRFDKSTPIMVATLGLVISIYGAVLNGTLSGVQAFLWVAGLGAIWSALRLTLGINLATVHPTAVGALTAHMLAFVFTSALAMWAVRKVLGDDWNRPHTAEPVRRVYAYLVGTLAAGLGFAFLMNADAAIVKHYFAAPEAGLFAQAAMVARVVVFLPMPVAGALFPKVVSSGKVSQASLRTLGKGLFLVSMMAVASAALCSFFPTTLLRLLTGRAAPLQVSILRCTAWAMAPLSVLYLLMNFELAQRRFATAIILPASAALYLVGVAVWHASVLQIIAVLSTVGITTLTATTLVIIKGAKLLPSWRNQP